MYGPKSARNLVPTGTTRRISNLAEDPTKPVIVLYGPPGSGKTTLAEERCFDLWTRNPQQSKLFRKFNCVTLDTFCADLHHFYLALNQPNGERFVGQTRAWCVLQILLKDLGSDLHSDKLKLFIFDDVEEIDQVLDILESFCKELESNLGARPMWKIFVTTQKKRDGYECIGNGNIVHMDEFDLDATKAMYRSSGLDEKTLKRIREVLGNQPLPLKIFLGSLNSNQIETDPDDVVEKELDSIELDARALIRKHGSKASRESSVLISYKIAIERLVEELSHPEESMQVIKTLTCFAQKNISLDMLFACAEQCSGVKDAKKVEQIIKHLMNRLVERDICTGHVEGGVRLFSLQHLIQRAMALFISEDNDVEKLASIENALIALNRVIPKDGRSHQPRLAGYYAAHGKCLNDMIADLTPLTINRDNTPFLLLLHSNLLRGIGYCRLAEFKESERGVMRLKDARDKYCELVRGCVYQQLCDAPQRAGMRPSELARSVAKELYDNGQLLDTQRSAKWETYRGYVRKMALFQRLTDKDLVNMGISKSAETTIHDHLTLRQLKKFEDENKVVDTITKLPKVYIAEVLAEMSLLWTKVYQSMPRTNESEAEHTAQLEAALDVYEEIYADHKVYLLAAVMTERQLLIAQLDKAVTTAEIQRISNSIGALSKVGQDSGKRIAFEAGLIRSNISEDTYHELICKESEMKCQGRLYRCVPNQEYLRTGKRLFEKDVKRLALMQVRPHSALCMSYRTYAAFLHDCTEFKDAVLALLLAMYEEHLYHEAKLGKSHPEFDGRRFSSLYRDLEKYYQQFRTARGTLSEQTKLIAAATAECRYVQGVKEWWDSTSGGQEGNQPVDSKVKWTSLVTIADEELPVQAEEPTSLPAPASLPASE